MWVRLIRVSVLSGLLFLRVDRLLTFIHRRKRGKGRPPELQGRQRRQQAARALQQPAQQ